MEIQPSSSDGSDIENQLPSSPLGSDIIENQLPNPPHGSDIIENQLPNPPHGSDIPSPPHDYRKLLNAAIKDEWKVGKAIIKNNPGIVAEKITKKGETVLHVATAARSIRFVRKLMKFMEEKDLEQKDNFGDTAFFLAVRLGFVDIAKAMVKTNDKLPNIGISHHYSNDLIFPISFAASAGFKPMVSYLFKLTNFAKMTEKQRCELLHVTICNEMYEVALNIFKKDEKLTGNLLEGNARVLRTLSQKSFAISNQQVKWKRKFVSTIFLSRSRFITWLLPKRYVLKKQAGLLLEKVWAECVKNSEEQLLEAVKKECLLHSAAYAGNVEFLSVAIRTHPELMWDLDDQKRTIFHVAVLHRQEKVFSLIHQIPGLKRVLHQKFCDGVDNILHLAGRLGYYNNNNDIPKVEDERLEDSSNLHHKEAERLEDSSNLNHEKAERLEDSSNLNHKEAERLEDSSNLNHKEKIMPASFLRVSGAALQMQREMLWFKEVEKLVPTTVQKLRNKDGKTPRELFTEEHKLLLKEGERWMKDTANSCMIAATLIATMVFAAGFTVPGGNNDDNGIPILLYSNGFRVFVISDAVALFSSIVSITIFLSILTSRYAEDDFLVSLPTKLLFGLTMLFVSIVSMLLAFTAAFFLFYGNHMGSWEPKLIAACAGVPVAVFGCLQYKLWFDVAKSTYWSKFYFRSRKYKFH